MKFKIFMEYYQYLFTKLFTIFILQKSYLILQYNYQQLNFIYFLIKLSLHLKLNQQYLLIKKYPLQYIYIIFYDSLNNFKE